MFNAALKLYSFQTTIVDKILDMVSTFKLTEMTFALEMSRLKILAPQNPSGSAPNSVHVAPHAWLAQMVNIVDNRLIKLCLEAGAVQD